MFTAIPVTYIPARAYDGEPYNNLKNHEILLEGAVKCNLESILVFDSHYLDLAGFFFCRLLLSTLTLIILGKKKLVEGKFKFIAKVNPMWWNDLYQIALRYLSDKAGEFVVLWSEELNEHFMVYNSIGKQSKLKRKCVLTNAFITIVEKNPGDVYVYS